MKSKIVELKSNEKYVRLLAGKPETAGLKSGFVTLQIAETVGEHKTEGKEEAIIILEGTADVVIAGKVAHVVPAPAVVYIPPETIHDIRNTGNIPLRYVYVTSAV
ncbi:MAG: cupin domain-containing protein [Deltaproteobacteria bacterium]